MLKAYSLIIVHLRVPTMFADILHVRIDNPQLKKWRTKAPVQKMKKGMTKGAE
jgi:hypothetical protein